MSAAEVAHRIHNKLYTYAEKNNFFTAGSVPSPDISKESLRWLGCHVSKIDENPYLEKADSILSGELNIFALHCKNMGKMISWNSDPKSGRLAPLIYGKSINYRDTLVVGDIKYLWEPNRHLHLVTLAQAYYLTGEEKYIDGLKIYLDSWFDQCPYLMGPNWTSSLELAIRLINWSIVWQLIGGNESLIFDRKEGQEFRGRWLASIYQHSHFIRHYFSLYSSANNHLIGEAAGLFVASTTWPYWGITSKWQNEAKTILIEEAKKQNYPDGVNKEQAISYQQFVLDFLILSAHCGEANGVRFSSEYWMNIEAMLEYIASIMDVAGNIPMIGDADDGYVVQLSQERDFCPYKSLLSTGAILFEREEFKYKSEKLDDKSQWLLGERAERTYNNLTAPHENLPIRRAFPEGGYYLLGDKFEAENEVRILVDAGSIGYLSIAAHGHADALSCTLSVNGKEILIDPGTYSYHTQKEWRDYFKGTGAHNTIRVDGLDQSVIGGNFMWLKKANTQVDKFDLSKDQDLLVACHDGYTRLRDPVMHRREIIYDKCNRIIRVTDILYCDDEHTIEQFWHFSEYCNISDIDDGYLVTNDEVSISLRLDESIEDTILRIGETSPICGWVSRRFDVKIPSPTIIGRLRINGETRIETIFDCN